MNVPIFIKGGIILQWNLQREYIEQNLCVQRNVADNDCKGQCHLKKQLDKVDNSEEENQAQIPLKLKLIESEYLPVLLSNISTNKPSQINDPYYSIGNSLYQFLLVKKNDRPPQRFV